MRSGSLDGLMTGPCGREVAPASLSARQESAGDLLTSVTSGPISSASSASVALTSALVNRLQAKMGLLGSTLYALTWKERTTPAGRLIPALRASVRRTSDRDCTGWPTPIQRDYKGATPGGRIRNGKLSTDTLDAAAQLTGPARLTVTGEMLTGSTAEMESGGQLSPHMSRWLMGYPPEWCECAMRIQTKKKKR